MDDGKSLSLQILRSLLDAQPWTRAVVISSRHSWSFDAACSGCEDCKLKALQDRERQAILLPHTLL